MPSPLSILIPIKNRTIFKVEHEGIKHELRLFEKNLESLFAICTAEDRWEILIVDFESTDVSMKTWIHMRNHPSQCSIRLISVEGGFSRGKGINIGVENSSYPTLLILDADMEIKTRAFFEDIEKHVVKDGHVLFPIMYSYTNPQHTEGYKRTSSTGTYSIQRSMFHPIRENTSWGKEDAENYNYFEKKQKTLRTYYDKEYIHQWNPNVLDFKNTNFKNTEVAIPKISPRFLPNPVPYQTSFPKKTVEYITTEKTTEQTTEQTIEAIEAIEQEALTNQRGSIEAFLLRKTHGTRSNLFLRKR